MSFLEDRLFTSGSRAGQMWNKKLCFEARDTFNGCVDKQPNGNKFRCPDELYAYEMWCPTEVRRLTTMQRRADDRDAMMFDVDMLANLNREKQTI